MSREMSGGAGDERRERTKRWTRADRGYEMVLSAEVQRLARELRIRGPMPRETLARTCHAEHWREGSFDGVAPVIAVAAG